LRGDVYEFLRFITGNLADKSDHEQTKKFAAGIRKSQKLIKNSIRYKASRYVSVYPLAVSEDVSADTVDCLRKYLEIRNARDIQIYWSNQPMARINSGSDSSIDDVVNKEGLDEKIPVSYIKQSYQDSTRPLNEIFQETSLNNLTLPQSYLISKQKQRTLAESKVIAKEILQQDPREFSTLQEKDEAVEIVKTLINKNSSEKDFSKFKSALEKWLSYAKPADEKKYLKESVEPTKIAFNEDDMFSLIEEEKKPDPTKDKKRQRPRNYISKMDIKQYNSLDPIIIECERTFVDDNNNKVTKNISFGVKEIVNTISNEDITSALAMRGKSSNFLATLTRIFSGEKDLIADLLFNARKSKTLATFKSKGGSALRRMNNINQSASASILIAKGYGPNIGFNDHFIPNMSLCVTRDILEKVRIETGTDMMFNTDYISKFMEEYLLIDFIVVDEDAGYIYFYTYGDDNSEFTRYNLSDLSKANLVYKDYSRVGQQKEGNSSENMKNALQRIFKGR